MLNKVLNRKTEFRGQNLEKWKLDQVPLMYEVSLSKDNSNISVILQLKRKNIQRKLKRIKESDKKTKKKQT